MPSLGPTELIVILMLAIVLFGAGKVGELGGALGKSIREFRRAANEEGPSSTRAASGVEEDAKHCTNCGSVVDKTDRFCRACGAKQEPNQAA